MTDLLLYLIISTLIGRNMNFVWLNSQIPFVLGKILFGIYPKSYDKAKILFSTFGNQMTNWLFCDICRPSVFCLISGLLVSFIIGLPFSWAILSWLGGASIARLVQ